MIDTLLNLWNVALIVIGFGLVIVIHELGHFAAARWAGIRCHAFAVGFGGAIISWRRGLGLRRGSSEPIYKRMLANAGGDPANLPDIGATEYRLNWIPFGGYVKMLGQEDIDPAARSDEPDSYQNAKVWKRMIVISAGVIANVILAAALFMIVFAAGLKEPAAIIGAVIPGSPADRAGLKPGDVVTSINSNPGTFSDLRIAAAMSGKGETLILEVDRNGETLTVEVAPEKKLGVPSIGVGPAYGAMITTDVHRASARKQLDELLAQRGLRDIAPGDQLIAINGAPVDAALHDVKSVIKASQGMPVTLTWRTRDGTEFERTLEPIIELQPSRAKIGDEPFVVEHVAGLTPLIAVVSVGEAAEAQGLRAGDVFISLGDVTWPGVIDGVREIRSRASSTIEARVLRGSEVVALKLKVNGQGQIGFTPSAARSSNIVARIPQGQYEPDWNAPDTLVDSAGHRLMPALVPGSSIVAVDDEPTASFRDIVLALKRATSQAMRTGAAAQVTIDVLLPGAATDRAVLPEQRELALTADEVRALHELAWRLHGFDSAILAPIETLVKAEGPLEALAMGAHRTKRIVLLTYLTFKRLFEGQLEVDQLRGPVGIAHTGFYFAERGIIWVLFFLAMVSANLAVVNFLPIPIADGGQFLLLSWEGIRGKPAPVAVQNVIALAGLVLIVGLFLFITFHDVARLLG